MAVFKKYLKPAKIETEWVSIPVENKLCETETKFEFDVHYVRTDWHTPDRDVCIVKITRDMPKNGKSKDLTKFFEKRPEIWACIENYLLTM